MDEKDKKLKAIYWVPGLLVGLFCLLWILSIFGLFPLTYSVAKTPAELNEFLDSPRDDMRGIKVNKHFLEIGKRPSMQILKGYDEHMFIVRPYRRVSLRPRNMTRPEVMDRCITFNGKQLHSLRTNIKTGEKTNPLWEGNLSDKKIKIFRAGMFNYFVVGLQDKIIFIPQVELCKRIGMNDDLIISRIIPVQNRWYQELISSSRMNETFHLIYPGWAEKDELIVWLNEEIE